MKTKTIFILVITLLVAGLLLLYITGFGHDWLSVSQVETIEVTACAENGTVTFQLVNEDIHRFVMCYNLSRHIGEVTAETCEQIFSVVIIMKDGRHIGIADHNGKRLKVVGVDDQSFWVDNTLLLRFVKEIITDRGLLWEPWSHCW